MTKKQLFDKGIYYNGTSMINGMHKFSAIVHCTEIGELRREAFTSDGSKEEAFACADNHYKQWEIE